MICKSRIRRVLFVATIIYISSIILIIIFGVKNNLHKADLIVVFGTKVNPDGHPSAGLVSRLDEAIAVYQKGLASFIFVSGGTGKEGYNEARVMAHYLSVKGIPNQVLIIDDVGVNTRATVINTFNYMQKHHMQSLVAVSQYYHLPRIRLAFKQIGIPNIGQSSPFYYSWRDVFSVNREIIAYVFYWLRLK